MSDFPRSALSDLLPLYASGDVSAATRIFLEQQLAQDPELQQELAELEAGDEFHPAALEPPPELAMRSLKSTRRRLALQRQVYAFAMIFTFIGLALKVRTDGFHVIDVHFMMAEMPVAFGSSLLIGLALWMGYFRLKRR